MKIAFDAKRALNNSSGLGNYARNLLNGLTQYYPENEYLLFSPKARNEFFNQLNRDFKIHFPETKIQKTLHPLWRSFGVARQLEKERVKIFHGLSNEIPFTRPSHSSLVPFIVTIHDLVFLKHKEQYPFIDRQIYELKTRYAAKHADRIIAVSNETKNDLIKFYGTKEEKIVVVSPIVDVAFQTQQKVTQPTGKKKYILHVGSFFPRKNQMILLEAFNLIKNKVEENLVLVGNSGNMKGKIEFYLEKMNLQHRVEIITDVTNEQLPAIYRQASLFVYPSLFEGFGMPIVEALFSGVPVITTRGSCFEEAGGKDSVYVNPKSAEEIADAMYKVICNENTKTQMISAGLLHAQSMGSKPLTEKLMGVYQSATQ